MSRRPPCRFHNSPGGCRQGQACKNTHTDPSSGHQGGGRSQPTAATGQSSRGRARGSSSQIAPARGSPAGGDNAPPGVCRFYWASGACNREFECRYRHVTSSDNVNDGTRTSHSPSAVQVVAPFLTEAGLARLTESGTDAFFVASPESLNPSMTHNHLKRFLADGYCFRNCFDVYAFCKLINNASSNNTTWSSEDGQLFMNTIATGTGLMRLNDILQWELVSIHPGSNRMSLSFQRGYLPILQYLTSEFVLHSVVSHLVNALYILVAENIEHFAEVVHDCMDAAVSVNKSFKEPGVPNNMAGHEIIAMLASVFYQCLTRFKNAVARYPPLRQLVLDLRDWAEAWIVGSCATPALFDDPFQAVSIPVREAVIQRLMQKVEQTVSIVQREQTKLDRPRRPVISTTSMNLGEGTLAALQNAYVGPGELRPDGSRHDNDHMYISDIRIAPTDAELRCRIQPFLPANMYGAPHFLPDATMERLLDIQFRLLREELTASLRISIQLVLDDLLRGRNTQLNQLMQKRGGKYRGITNAQDSVMFNVYTNVDFHAIVPDSRGLAVTLSLDTPPGRARSTRPAARAAFWQAMSSKRLMQGGLVALIWQQGTEISVHLGTVASSARDHTESAKREEDRIPIRVMFFDPEVELRILHESRGAGSRSTKLLVEATVMYESIRPFLEAMRVEPEVIPMSRYLAQQPPGSLATMQINPPAYARQPNFSYQLASLFPPEAGVHDLKLNVLDTVSIQNARQLLKQESRLDPSQADAIVDSLIRELVLIQGPPGTGKSYTGVELLRVLLQNKAGPILLIAFTNHALDHMLCSVLDANITKKMVRLGSRSADERIAQFSMDNMEKVAGKSRIDLAFNRHYRSLKDTENEIKALMASLLKTTVESEEIVRHIEIQFPSHFQGFIEPPQWIAILYSFSRPTDGTNWKLAGKNGRDAETDDSLYGYWTSGQDLTFLETAANPTRETEMSSTVQQQLVTNSAGPDINVFNYLTEDIMEDSDDDAASDNVSLEEAWKQHDVKKKHANVLNDPQESVPHAPAELLGLQPEDLKNPDEFFIAMGSPQLTTTDRPIEDLLNHDDVWTMSRSERERLHQYWTSEIRLLLQQTRIEEFERLRNRHAEALKRCQEGKDESRKQLLRNVDIVGCTTTGAAKLTALLNGIGPRVMLVEEAGQVLEAHVLGSLVPSVQHLILIGDPLQLRPTLNNYSLSIENKWGGMLYSFDMSLMERLSKGGLPMSQIDVQRRMRPTIANLIRTTLYPNLQDHDLVKQYPPVQGMVKNVFFLSHSHKENGGDDDSISKKNVFEVEMIRDMVLYLLRQGPYSAEGDIVVLCAYLGQLAAVRDALSQEIAVIIDERDQAELDDRETDNDLSASGPNVEHVQVTKRVRLRTVDNFQGEEATIIILSLVRNSGGGGDNIAQSIATRANIGFLKSENRTNVALSRARHGLYILGNATDLASRSKMWGSVITELEKDNSIGDAFPVACNRHRDDVQFISKPGQLPRIAPDGGCLRQCDSRLKCGHLCPYKCHSDDPGHVAVRCEQHCTKLCSRGHPCAKRCSDDCGKCGTPIANVELPCGHTISSIPCFQLDDLAGVFCKELLTRALPKCEHSVQMHCSDVPAQILCKAVCGGEMMCCGRNCKSECYRCQEKNIVQDDTRADITVYPVKRKTHSQHSCGRTLYCEHLCDIPCSEDHQCTTKCKAPCRQVCPHARCKSYCSTPCAPCQEPCTWQCPHDAQSCPVPCGSVCARLPCDRRCDKVLACGHQCPSVCGEDCSIQICPQCASPNAKQRIVDMIMQRALEDLNPNEGTLDELLITLPNCRHFFTVETLDGICEIGDYYRRDDHENWSGLQAPATDFKKPPTCPTCRSAITAPRYGRIFKRADLDILENNVACSMAQSLTEVQRRVESASKKDMEKRLQEAAAKLSTGAFELSSKHSKTMQKRQAAVLNEQRNVPVAQYALDPANDLHSIPTIEATAWRKATSALLLAYESAVKVAHTRSAHSHAWEASFTYLYQKEMDLATAVPTRAPRQPHEHAMRMAKLKVGQPAPIADKRFLVEAFWLSINIRFTILDLAQTWLAALNALDSYPKENRRLWANYMSFLHRACTSDAQIALNIAKQSGSHRQATKTAVLIMRAQLEQFRFNIEMMKQERKYADTRVKLADRADQYISETSKHIRSVATEHRKVKRDGRQEEEKWLSENFLTQANMILEDWKALGQSLRQDTFYQPLSLDEITAIVKGLNFSHTGHFYKCPNGHTFVIADCGGAMQQAFCPECGQAIGGSNHTLLSTNTRATEFEAVARAQGADQSPWTWGR